MKLLLTLLFILNTVAFSNDEFTCLDYIATEEEETRAISEMVNWQVVHPKERPSKILNRNEISVIQSYTSYMYKGLNPVLRSGKYSVKYHGLEDSFLNITKTLCSALTKLPRLNSSKLYRVAKINEDVDLFDFYQDGHIIEEKSFVSTSTNMAGIKRFAPKLGKDHILFHIYTNEAKDISYFSVVPRENEALIPAGLKFKVTHKGRSSENGPYLIILDQVD